MAVTSSVDFDNVADDNGEDVTIYNATETINVEGSLTDQSLGNGTIEKAKIQPENLNNIARSEGRLQQGDLFAMFKSTSVITANSLVKLNKTSTLKLFKVKNLTEERHSGATHHFESNLEFLRDTTA